MKSLMIAVLFLLGFASACTNMLITKGASADGSNMIGYNADSHTLYGELYHYPAGSHPAGSMREIIDWDSGERLGEIPEAPVTYNVIGNINEFQLIIGESTYGGLPDLQSQPAAIMDYGSLIWITLQRSKNAREAISTMGTLVATYGYASEGESFSIADTNEVWVLEMIGKGKDELGAVWVAVRIPDGAVTAHANQARIRTFPLNDPNNAIYSSDVISFAKKKGYYPASAPDADFSFSDVYDPVTFEGARFCEGRVWQMFRKVCGAAATDPYLSYVQGYNVTNRMPLWMFPAAKVSVNDTMNFLRDHFENTWLDFSSDVGAGPFGMPYRQRPLTFVENGNTYVNERAAGTQQTGWTFVAQARPSFPDAIGGLIWFGVDDAASTVYAPMYACMTRIPQSHAPGDIMSFSFNSAFWVFNMVSNWAYTRYRDIHPEIAAKIAQYEAQYYDKVAAVDKQALAVYQTDPVAAVRLLTDFSVSTGETLTQEWLGFWQQLFVKYMDGNIKTVDPAHPTPFVVQPGYDAATYKRIVAETGDHYREFTPTKPANVANKLRFI